MRMLDSDRVDWAEDSYVLVLDNEVMQQRPDVNPLVRFPRFYSVPKRFMAVETIGGVSVYAADGRLRSEFLDCPIARYVH